MNFTAHNQSSVFQLFMQLCFSICWQGLSFLDLRYHLLLFYLQDLTHLISIKSEGGRISESEALSRVVAVRTVRYADRLKHDVVTKLLHRCWIHKRRLLSCEKVLEKMRPLDHKLKYQIDKLVRTAVTGSLGNTNSSLHLNQCECIFTVCVNRRLFDFS